MMFSVTKRNERFTINMVRMDWMPWNGGLIQKRLGLVVAVVEVAVEAVGLVVHQEAVGVAFTQHLGGRMHSKCLNKW